MPLGEITEAIAQATGAPFALARAASVGGGCISRTQTLTGTDGRRFFLKSLPRADAAMLEAEAIGLRRLHATGAIRVPLPICGGEADEQAFLVLEHCVLRRTGDDAAMGRQLAALHRVTAPRFGWEADNFIGGSPQPNPWTDDWIEFFRTQRLGFQLDLAARAGLHFRGVDSLLEGLPRFFCDGLPEPSLLHGDLWGGNAAFDAEGQPVLFDPAAHYGDREADLAMTELFGGFRPAFYEAYATAWPLRPGHRERVPLYHLYHVLNHANLFGGGYTRQAQSLIDQLTAGA